MRRLPTTDRILLAADMSPDPASVPVTVALTRADGTVLAGRGTWC